MIGTPEQRREKVLGLLRELELWLSELEDRGTDPNPEAFRATCDEILIAALGGSTTAPYTYLRDSGCPALDTACALVGIGYGQWGPMVFGKFEDDLPGQNTLRWASTAGTVVTLTVKGEL